MTTLSTLHALANARAGEILAAPTVSSVQPPGTEKANQILDWIFWGGGFVAVASIMWCAYLFMFSPNRHQNDGMGSLGKVAVGMVLLGAGTSLVGAFGL
jgi:hypothetical protein